MLRGLEARLVVGSLLTCALKQTCNVVWLFVVLFLLCVFCVFLRRLFARKGCSWGGLGHPLVSLSASCWPRCSGVSIFVLCFSASASVSVPVVLFNMLCVLCA